MQVVMLFCTLCRGLLSIVSWLLAVYTGVTSWKQSVADIKAAIWRTCAQSIVL